MVPPLRRWNQVRTSRVYSIARNNCPSESFMKMWTKLFNNKKLYFEWGDGENWKACLQKRRSESCSKNNIDMCFCCDFTIARFCCLLGSGAFRVPLKSTFVQFPLLSYSQSFHPILFYLRSITSSAILYRTQIHC